MSIILWLAAIGVILGGIDYLLGNKFGLGAKFEEGFTIMAQLALSATGIIVLAPVLAQWLQPVLVPVFRWMHADPAMFASIIANDMGGYPLATMLAESPEMGLMAGCITASMLGCTITFSLPVGLGIIEKDDQIYFIRGMLIGLITIPVGSVAGGLIAGFDPVQVLLNNIPIAALSAVLAVGLILIPDPVCRAANAVGKGVGWIGIAGIVIGAFEHLTGVTVPGFEAADTIMNGLAVAAEIAVVLIGILPVLELLTRVLGKPLAALGKLLGISADSASGLIYTMANPVPTFSMLGKMDPRGKVVNIAWLVSAAAALGDHLGFTAGVQPEMVLPMISGKLLAGACAVVIACCVAKKASP